MEGWAYISATPTAATLLPTAGWFVPEPRGSGRGGPERQGTGGIEETRSDLVMSLAGFDPFGFVL